MVAAASIALASGSLALAAPSQASGPAPAAKTITGSHPSWATASADTGSAAASAEFTGTVYLAGQDSAGLAAYAKSVSDPHGADYGHFLTPAAYQARYGATKAQIASVRSWLTGAGLTVVRADTHAITVKGSNAAVDKAFGTGIHQYKVAGKLRHAPARNVVVPASAASAVLGVTGLSSVGPHVARPDSVKVSDAVGSKGSKPADGLPTTETCSDYWGQKTATGAPAGYVQLRGAASTSARSPPRSCARPTASPPPA